jgi:hypothetical protein
MEITKESFSGIELEYVVDKNLKCSYSQKMYESLQSEPKYIKMIDEACNLKNSTSLNKEVKNFRKIALKNKISEEEIKRVSMKVWGLSNYEYSDCI